jgi:hypothetical protein
MHSESFCTSYREKGGDTTRRNSINNEISKVGPPQVTSRFTSVNDVDYKSCATSVLVNVSVDSNPVNKLKCYASVDEQSIRRWQRMSGLHVDFPEEAFHVNTCSRISVTKGLYCTQFIVSSVS